MKALNVLFFHVYNHYYQNGNDDNDIPHLTAWGIVGCSFSCLLATMTALTITMVSDERIVKPLAIGIMVLGLILTFFQFLYQSRYSKIYEEIRGTNYDSVLFKTLTWAVVAAGFISTGIFAYIFNQPKG